MVPHSVFTTRTPKLKRRCGPIKTCRKERPRNTYSLLFRLAENMKAPTAVRTKLNKNLMILVQPTTAGLSFITYLPKELIVEETPVFSKRSKIKPLSRKRAIPSAPFSPFPPNPLSLTQGKKENPFILEA